MILISKDGNSAIEVKQVAMSLEYDRETMIEAGKIKEDVFSKNGYDKKYARLANICVKDYLSEKQQVCRILVNNKFYFGDYEKEQGKFVFEKIVNALKNGDAYFDMMDIKFNEE